MTNSPTREFLAALDKFVDGCREKIHAHCRLRNAVRPTVDYDLTRTRARVYRINTAGSRTELSYVDLETGAVYLPTGKKIARGNILLPDNGLKNIADDGRPAFVR